MLTIPIEDVFSQTVKARLGGQACTIEIYQKSDRVYCDLKVNNELIVGGVHCHDVNRIVRDPYLGFEGDLIFMDTEGWQDPVSPGLGTRFLLIYLSADEIANMVTVKPVVKAIASTFYTTTLYPILVEDTMTQGLPVVQFGAIYRLPSEDMSQAVPSLLLGTLVSSITYVNYFNQRDVNPETMTHPVPTLVGGVLTVVVAYVDYLNHRDVTPDSMTHPVPTLLSGTMAVTVSYVDYFNQRDVAPDTMTHPVPTLLSGTLS